MGGNITKTSEKTNPNYPKNIHKCIQKMARHPRKSHRRLKEIQEALDKIGDMQALKDTDKKHGHTVLHTAVRYLECNTDEQDEQSVVELLTDKFPQLILCDRPNTVFEGQTPLHMAVCKGNIWLVTVMLQQLSKHESKKWKTTVLKRRACGSIFANTVMLGELPLSIAALTFNKDMIDLLLDEGAELDGTNSAGDNVCHSLVRYGQQYPGKKVDVINICRKLVNEPMPSDKRKMGKKQLRKLRKKILLMENKEGLNALKLSVKLGCLEMFEFFIDQKPCCHTKTQDGLFEVKLYDLTEIDTISFPEESDNQRDNNQTNPDQQPDLKTQTNPDQQLNLKTKTNPDQQPADQQPDLKTQTNPDQQHNLKTKKFDRSILMMMFDLDPDVAFQFISFTPIRLVVNRKWNAYIKYFCLFWLFHFVFICFLTWYSVERSQQVTNSQAGYDFEMAPKYELHVGESPFVREFGGITVLVGIALVGQELYRTLNGRMPWSCKSLMNPYGCDFFRIMFVALGVGLIVDYFLVLTLAWYENYLLIISVFLGWFLNIFFIRTLKPFSFFTVLIQNVILGDMLRFFVIIGFELVAFATAMYMAIQGSDSADDPNYSDFGRVMFSMFTLIVGLGDTVDFYQTRQPLLCIAIFIGFVVMTTLLMINGLIAIMSRTCTELVENVGNMKASDRHSKLQRLSVILFIESILIKSLIEKVGIPKSVRSNRKKVKHYMLELSSLQCEDDGGSDSRPILKVLGIDTFIGSFRHSSREAIQGPSSGNNGIFTNVFKGRTRVMPSTNDTEGNQR